MKVYSPLLFVIAASLATAPSTLASEGIETPASGAQKPESSSATKLPRARLTDDYDGDRKFALTQFDRVIKFLKDNFTPANLRDQLRPRDTPKEAFEILELHKKKIYHNAQIREKEVVNFFSSRRFKAWLEHVKQYRGPHAYEDMFKCLDDIFGEENFGFMIKKMQMAKKTRKLGKNFEAEKLKRDAMRLAKYSYLVKAIAGTKEP